MATLLNDRDSTVRHLDLTRRHVRLCRQVKGAGPLATAIESVNQALIQKQAATKTKFDARQDALDDFILRDLELDDSVRTAFEKCKQFDRDNPTATVLLKIFPSGTYSELTNLERSKEPDVIEQLAVRFESLGATHALFAIAADLKAKVNASRTALTDYQNAIRNHKLAEADEEIAQADLRLQYETNYLEARKTFGRTTAQRLFPRHSRESAREESGESGGEPSLPA